MESSCFLQKFQDISVRSQGNFLIFVVSVLKLILSSTSQGFQLSLLSAQLIAQVKVALSQAFGWHIAELPWHRLERNFLFQEVQFFPAFTLMQPFARATPYSPCIPRCQRDHTACAS